MSVNVSTTLHFSHWDYETLLNLNKHVELNRNSTVMLISTLKGCKVVVTSYSDQNVLDTANTIRDYIRKENEVRKFNRLNQMFRIARFSI